MNRPSLAERIAAVRDRISESCRRAGRAEGGVRLVAVSKKRPAADIEAAAALGVTDFGENRIQEAAAKLPDLRASITPHLIGHLQRNKARQAAGLFPVVQSVDSVALATRLSAMVGQGVVPPRGPPIRVLAQVDLAGETSKFGIPEADLPRALEEIARLPGLRLSGLMLMPPFDPDPEAVRPWFVRLRELGRGLAERGLLPRDPDLSMGMSHDFEVAIAEGATTIRVGTAIFGPRTP
ncbi:MAG: YggS family pyridoxal phosphate-dependent enzyme [Acidobacteriota bacterium]|nr:YggS family pyridoxal phosphate-dependent enzyme [Acidobacteriota bacterium]